RELVDDDVVALALAALLHLAPSKQNGPLLPRLAAQEIVARVDHAVLVHYFPVAHEELVGIEHDRREGRVAVEAQVQDRQAGKRRDTDAHLVGDRKAVCRLEALLVQEQQRELAQTREVRGGQPSKRGARGYDARPDRVRNRFVRENALAPPALEQIR